MNDLVNDIITWESLVGYDRSKFDVSVDSAVLKQKESCFEMSMTLNSIVPIDEELRLKAHIISGVPGLKSVNIKYKYKDLILSKADTVRLALPHAIKEINGEYAAFTRMIKCDSVKFDEESNLIIVGSVGKTVTECLNKDVSRLFEEIFKRDYGITAHVIFANNEQDEQSTAEASEIELARIIEETEKIALDAANDPNKQYGKSKKDKESRGSKEEGPKCE